MLEVNFRRLRSAAVLELCGDIDINCANFIETVGWCLSNGYRMFLWNFANVNLLDYAGLSVLAIAYKDVINHSGRVKLAAVPAHIKNILSMSGMDRVIEIYPDEESAIVALEEEEQLDKLQHLPLRRRFRRLPLEIEAYFKALDKKDAALEEGTVLNLSAVGVLLFCKKTYPVGTLLELVLKLTANQPPLQLKAKVVWLVDKLIQPQIYPGMGLEFCGLDNQTQKKIAEFVERNLPLSCQNE